MTPFRGIGAGVEPDMPMPVRRVVAHDRVEEDRGRVAMQRGPLVYCVEWPDRKGGSVSSLVLPGAAPLSVEFRGDLLGGVAVIRGEAQSLRRGAVHERVVKANVAFAAIPYYAWANRGQGEMEAWLARTEAGARPVLLPTIASTSTPTASAGIHEWRVVAAAPPAPW